VIAVLLILVVLGLVVGGLWCDQLDKADVREHQKRAESAIDREANRTKRAMNDAAGQSWRNLVE
jgi:sensor domain CHASE-containing protein